LARRVEELTVAPSAFAICRQEQPLHVGKCRSTFHGAGEALTAPRMLSAARHSCSTTSAQEPVCQPQAIQSALLARKTQKPISRRRLWVDATSQAASTVTSIAGH